MVCRWRQLKKRSVARRPERPVFFIDRSLGRIDVPNALHKAGHQCELHDDHFSPGTPDNVWLAEVGARTWVVLTKDERIRYRPLELQALRNAKLRAFILVCGNVRGADTADILLKAMSRIIDILGRYRGPFVYYVYKNSSMRLAL
jgi:hypothetical protein